MRETAISLQNMQETARIKEEYSILKAFLQDRNYSDNYLIPQKFLT